MKGMAKNDMFRLLIVDDEPYIADSLFEYIRTKRSDEYEVYISYSGEEALSVLSESRIDIVLSDINMTGIDGLQLLERINEQWPKCRVIFLTGYDKFEYAYEAISNRCAKFLLKNEGYDTILKNIDEVAKELKKTEIYDILTGIRNKQDDLNGALLRER